MSQASSTPVGDGDALAPGLHNATEMPAKTSPALTTCPEYLVRLATIQDQDFICANWSNGVRETNPYCYIPKPLFASHQTNHMLACLEHFNTLVFCHPEDPTQCFGFLCYTFVGEVLVIHWMYIKYMWRCLGLTNDIISNLYGNDWKAKPIVITQMSKYYRSLKKNINLTFDPYYVPEHVNVRGGGL